MIKNSHSVFDMKGNVAVNNLNPDLLDQVMKSMRRKNAGICVARNFNYMTEYLMLVIDVSSKAEEAESRVKVALWPDSDDSWQYVTRDFVFMRTENGIRKWEEFCEKVSGSSAVMERDLIGNLFIGRIIRKQSCCDDRVRYFENLIVDRFLGRIDPVQIQASSRMRERKLSPRLRELLSEDEE